MTNKNTEPKAEEKPAEEAAPASSMIDSAKAENDRMEKLVDELRLENDRREEIAAKQC